MRILKKFICGLIAVVIVFSLLPMTVLAVGEEIASGTCGENVTWVLDESGILTISGIGRMYDFLNMAHSGIAENFQSRPWYDYQQKVTAVYISEGVTSIGINSFDSFSNLVSISIPNSVIEIGYGAFWGCTSLTSLNIPEGVISIGDMAFLDCSGLESITIPESVSNIGKKAFWRCPNLREILVSRDNPYYSSDEYGVFFDKEKTELICYPGGRTGGYSVPESVTYIREVAFEFCQNLASINLPEGLSQIEERAFLGCSNLTSVVIPNSVTSLGTNAFAQCTGLTNVTVSDSLSHLGDGVFAGCPELTSIIIPESVTSVNVGAFFECSNLSSVTFTENISSIGEDAFTGCNSMNDVYYYGTEEDRTQMSIGKGNDDLINATWHYDCDTPKADGLVVYSDHTNMSICTGDIITLGAGILENGERINDVSGVTFQIADESVLNIVGTDVKGDCRYIEVKGLKPGTSIVSVYDSLTDQTVQVPITVYDRTKMAYTLSSVPTQHNGKYPTNFYNFNGLYIDNYSYTVNADKSATVNFDVYNTTHAYGMVEVYDKTGNIDSGVLIQKNKSSNTSIKEALWDNIAGLAKDIHDGDLMTYRQESGYSKHTPVAVTIPEGGYILIGVGSEKSPLIAMANYADIMMSFASLAGEIADYDVNSTAFTEKLT